MTRKPKPHIVLAAGGTGGHVFPAVALASILTDREVDVTVVTDRRGDAFKGLPDGVVLRHLRAGGVAGLGFVDRVKNLGRTVVGCGQAIAILRSLRAQVVIGFGGYASLPTVLAATVLGLRTVIHEQNAILGRANRLLGKRVQRIAASFERVGRLPETARGKLVFTGMPVRRHFSEVGQHGFEPPGDGGPVRIAVIGGSQGARIFSQVVPAAIERLADDFRRRIELSQQCRPEDLGAVRAAYDRLSVRADLQTFFTDMPARLTSAHILIARSGASTVAEVAAVGRPAIFVPYPFAADDHQAANARAVVDKGGGWMVPQQEFTPDRLAEDLTRLIHSPAELAAAANAMRSLAVPDAAARLADVVLSMAARPSDSGIDDERQSA